VCLRAVFAGTPPFAAVSLKALLNSSTEILAVYTQPDRPAGRGRKLQQSPVKLTALEHNLLVRQPLRLVEEADQLTALSPDILIVVAYGLILPKSILNVPALGCINVHASLLPRWRGAAPIQRAIEAGDSETGITVMQMDEGLDTGGIISQVHTPVFDTDNAGSLDHRLAELGAGELIRLLPDIAKGHCQTQPQTSETACTAKKVSRAESRLNWQLPAAVLERRIRAFNPWPLARTELDGKALLVLQADLGPSLAIAPPGTVIQTDSNLLRVQTGDGTLDLLQLQVPGRKPLAVSQFLNGYRIRTGQRFNLI
jgi:methionyl-tRNA formyltransferase